MPEINYKDLTAHLKGLEKLAPKDPFASVYLIYGEELLCKTAFGALLDAMIPASVRSLNYEPMDGVDENIHEVIERINTFSLLPSIKVIALIDSRVFYSKQDEEKFLEKAKDAFDHSDMIKAGRYLASLLGKLNLSYDDVSQPDWSRKLKLDLDRFGDDAWLEKTINFCAESRLPIPESQDVAQILERAVEKGFPKGNHLIITTDMVDKRRSLFKILDNKGMIIDCSVPKGDRRTDQAAQEAVLIERMTAILSQNKKTMDGEVFSALQEMTGFDLRTFSSNLEILVSYVGDRTEITLEDVESVLRRTKKDPIYELTNAIADRSVERCLFFMNSLLSNNFFPLQILAAMTNQIRKLLVVKDFVESPHGDAWQAGLSYGQFQSRVMPAIQEFDRALSEHLEKWEETVSPDAGTDTKKEKKKGAGKKRVSATDLLIAKNPKNSYPIFQMLLKSEKFSKEDLLSAMENLSSADLQLKSTGHNPRIILERAIFSICQKTGKSISPSDLRS